MRDWSNKLRGLLSALLPASLQHRIAVLMAVSVFCAQMVGISLWASQIRANALDEAKIAARNMSMSAAGTLRFFADLPLEYRPVLIEQLRTMGGTRFFVNINKGEVPLVAMDENQFTKSVTDAIGDELERAAPFLHDFKVAFVLPQDLIVSDDGLRAQDLPKEWVETTLLLKPRPAPVLVIQAASTPGDWLYLAATMPDPYFLDNASPITSDLAALQLLVLIVVVMVTVLIVKALIKPLNRIAEAADAFVVRNADHDRLPEAGSKELRRTAQAFNAMQARIQNYIVDRENLFVGISHNLKTPIMRLKLRTEMLDDETIRAEFHEDLDDLDLMVKSALQKVRDSDIHENRDPVKLDNLLVRLSKRPIYPDSKICLSLEPCVVSGRRLALSRAFANLIDNAVLYGQNAQVNLVVENQQGVVTIRDFGPGIAPDFIGRAFEPRVRLAHGQQRNSSGSGLGLGIARSIILAHGGTISLSNHPDGGLVVRVSLPF